jgi:CubicO group peptidase (beta-lactamase class C family)
MNPRSFGSGSVWLVAAALAVANGCGGSSAPAPLASPIGAGLPPVGPAPAHLDLSAPWVEAAPGDVGMDAVGLGTAAARAEAVPRFRSLLVARHGRLVLEEYFHGGSGTTPFDVRSVTKSVVSSLVGIAFREGVLPGEDASVGSFLEPPYVLDDADRRVTLHHLLTMTSGYLWDDGADYNPWIFSSDRVQFLLDRPHAHPPGTEFTYDSAAVHVLGVALQRAAGKPLPQYANERLFGALGVTGVAWEELDRGTVNGAAGIRLLGRDLLKFGQLFLQHGWSGERNVVPEAWVDEVTAPHFPWRDDHGAQKSVTYGMLWWVSDAEPAAYFAWGYGGQFVYVVPSLELVVVTTTDWTSLTETTPEALAQECLGVIVTDVLPAAR